MVFFVRSGEIEIESKGQRVAIVQSGAMIGEMAALLAFCYPDIYGNLKRSATARALDPAECNAVPWKQIDQILHKYPAERETLLEKAKKRHAENLARM